MNKKKKGMDGVNSELLKMEEACRAAVRRKMGGPIDKEVVAEMEEAVGDFLAGVRETGEVPEHDWNVKVVVDNATGAVNMSFTPPPGMHEFFTQESNDEDV